MKNQKGGYRLNRDEIISLFEFPSSKTSLEDRLKYESHTIRRVKTNKKTRRRNKKTRRRKK